MHKWHTTWETVSSQTTWSVAWPRFKLEWKHKTNLQESIFQNPNAKQTKYAGIHSNDLITIYKLFIRSVAEYCSTVYHTSLTKQQAKKLELIQSTSLKVILGSEYIDYTSSLTRFSLSTLYDRRSERVKSFTLRCIQDKFNKAIFPLNSNVRNSDIFEVNFARTSRYYNSAVPQCQRILNSYAKNNPDLFKWYC